MDDLISRQAAIDAFKKELTVGESKGNYVTICSAVGYEGAKQILESLPSADTDLSRFSDKLWAAAYERGKAEVVRCKDCKWFNDIGCAIRIVDDSDKPTENDYCSFGEWKDDK